MWLELAKLTWETCGGILEMSRLRRGLAEAQQGSLTHLGIKQGWTKNEREFLLLVLVFRVGMQPKPLDLEGRTVVNHLQRLKSKIF
jgi:hypothetical protein